MKNELKFYVCSHCGNLVYKLHDSDAPLSCCGDIMNELEPNVTDGATEKHVPVVTINGDEVCVQVGSALHPMLPEHHIEWILLHTENGIQVVNLEVGAEPKALFTTNVAAPLEVYEWCNLHGLWKVQL